MKQVSTAYKDVMDRRIRNRTFISVGIGVVNQEAQKNASASGDFAYFSDYNRIFDQNTDSSTYAALEENMMRCDGSQFFVPPNDEFAQYKHSGLVTGDMLGSVMFELGNTYSIKGLTIDFGEFYPTLFEVQTEEKSYAYENNSSTFQTTDLLGDTDYILITPLKMVGGKKRLRIKSILMGVGLFFGNKEIKDANASEFVSSISDELPYSDFNLTVLDIDGVYDVDNDNSFINFLENMQNVNVSYGLEMDAGNIEWVQFGNFYLSDWESKKGYLSIKATDRLSQSNDEYTLGNRIYQRTAYEEATSIFEDMGLEPDEYVIDEYLRDVILTNPMPEGKHKDCLQILANACRCILFQNPKGQIVIQANFSNVIEPEDLTVTSDSEAVWSKPTNILYGTNVEYADLSMDFTKTDATMYMMPTDGNYLETAYVSEEMSNIYGTFENNPTFTIELPAGYVYYSLNMEFGGTPPLKFIIHTFLGGEVVEDVEFGYEDIYDALYPSDELLPDDYLYPRGKDKNVILSHEFLRFDTMTFEFVETEAFSRILVNKISFGEFTNYVLKKRHMKSNPIGYSEEITKSVAVKVFAFENDDNGEPQEVRDNVYYSKVINSVGINRKCENPLIATQEHAELLAVWLSSYYANNISYDVDYRGEPRLNAADVIYMESKKSNTLQVEITSHELSFNGALNGKLEMRKALRMAEV